MKTITAELWNGNLSPVSLCGRGDPEIQHLEELIEQNKDNLFGMLDNFQKKLLDNYSMCINEYVSLVTEHAFSHGFNLACQLLSQALTAPISKEFDA